MSGSPIQILFSSFLVLMLTVQGMAQPVKTAVPDMDSLSWYIQMKYGPDQELFNGFQYYQRFIQCRGDPYFPENSFYKGSITLRGKQYDEVKLKYDIFSQHLVLEYTDFKNRYNQLIIESIHTDSFRLETDLFIKMSISGGKPLFYQVLNSGPVICYVHWSKITTSISYNFQYTHEFTEPIGKFFLKYRGKIQPFTNRNSFLSIFPESLHPDIRKYFRQQKLSFREAGPKDIQNLLNFVDSKIETNTEH